jgi:hypothetical protein
VEDDAPQTLHVEGPHAQLALGGLAGDREGLDQEIVEKLSLLKTLFELVGLGAEFRIGEGFDLLAKFANLLHLPGVAADFTPGGVIDPVEHTHDAKGLCPACQ